jgi:predicted glycosyltransferase
VFASGRSVAGIENIERFVGWKNTRVVKTRNALALSHCADLVVSAAGYNSFHEIMYHGIPSILIPQMAPFMDDQERRARAASERGLASSVLGHEMLLLERELLAHLDDGKSASVRKALIDIELPATGNSAAARLIEKGMCDE